MNTSIGIGSSAFLQQNIGDVFENFHYGYKPINSTIVVNLGVFPDASEGTREEDDEEAGNANEEDEDNEDGQVEESSGAMGEQCNGYQVSPSLRKPGLTK